MSDTVMNPPAGSMSRGNRSDAIFIAGVIVVGAIAMAQPWLGVSSYFLTLIYYVAYYLALGQAWNLMSGLTGYVSFSHGALAGIGAYAVVLSLNGNLPMALALVVAAIATVAASLIIGATALRLRGTAFTFATLFFQELVLLLVRKLPFTGGSSGLILYQIIPVWIAYVMMVTVAVAATIAFALTRRSRLGIRMLAIKGDESAAAAIGIDSTRLKIILFCASAGIAGLVGAVHGIFVATLYPEVIFSVDLSIVALAVALIGGVGSAAGPIAGAIVYVGLREIVQVVAPGAHLVIIGLLLLGIILFLRDGIVPAVGRLVSRKGSRSSTSGRQS